MNYGEMYRLKDEIETKVGDRKVGNFSENTWKKLRRLKMIDNREEIWKKNKGIKTNYVSSDNNRKSSR